MDALEAILIPLGGNAFITKQREDAPEVITEYGLGNWIVPESTCSVFFRTTKPESFDLALRLKVPESGRSRIGITVKGYSQQEIDVTGNEYTVHRIGRYNAAADDYVQVDIVGISRTGDFFGDVSHLVLSSITGQVHHVGHPQDFYFGRRGPSVHFNYDISCISKPVQYFYNEVNCGEGQDVVGSYFCAAGFSGGYFGMQVNGPTERRILFSIWSAYNTDDPAEIPEDYQVQLLKKGPDVVVQSFGNEGAGKQSFLRYNWSPGVTYKFLVFGSPVEQEQTVFTAWFFTPETMSWNLIASFKKPKTSCYLKSLYSFSENFIPEMGHVQRTVEFGNQWVRDVEGKWHEVCSATFTGDSTANEQQRHDHAGGVTCDGKFYLTNCGFTCSKVETDQTFSRKRGSQSIPNIDFSGLP